MATCDPNNKSMASKREERRKQVLLGELPSDFLRVTPNTISSLTQEQQIALDEQAAIALQHASTISGRLTISVIEAKLNKNYGLTRMDPYVRLRVGQTIYETNTDYNGARNPRWNKNFNCFFMSQDTTIYIEIFDECAFSLDERIAWANYQIPQSVLQGQTVNEWIELSGKLGEDKEGLINLIITYQVIPSGTLIYHPQSRVSVVPYGPFQGKDGTTNSTVPNRDDAAVFGPYPDVQSDCPIPEEDYKQVMDMFPNIEESVVRDIMESNRGNKDLTINVLLEMSDVT
ncbi:toll-interacting protein isoform X2 [Parasteatoda tepidariorum]|uniref:toll-interacting protein isoform X2 n=1 Tax=Parasteatoda tepidariorum TaxID=114398 RepID=UPI00077FB32C|nr:toll-interacting protein isoform X2 [Parasteatoda tepidariorum]